MPSLQSVERVVDLLNPDANILLNVSYEDAVRRVAAADLRSIREIDGQFAILAEQGKTIRMARSIGRPMRYFRRNEPKGLAWWSRNALTRSNAFFAMKA